jgi:hypothetical protein
MDWREGRGARRKALDAVVCGDDGAEISETSEAGMLFCVLPSHVELRRDWRACGTLPLYEGDAPDARLWMRWPSHQDQWDEDVKTATDLVKGPLPVRVQQRTAADVVIRVVESEEDVARVMLVLRAKFGPAGERWYEPSEICESFVRSGVFVVCDSRDDGPVGCCGAVDWRRSTFAASRTVVGGREYRVREGWELTHYAVLGIGGGKYAGVASRMQEALLARLAVLGKGKSLPVLLDTTFDRSRADGGGAWKLGARDARFDFVLQFIL